MRAFCRAGQGAVRAAAPRAMNVLVTGASGLVGRQVVACLLDAGRAVTAFVRTPGRLGYLARERLAVVTGTVEDPAAIARAAEGCDAVIHLANASGVVD